MSAPNRCLISLILFTIVVVGIIATVSLILGFLIALYTPEEDNNNGGIVGQGGNGGGVDTNGSPDGYNGEATEALYESEHYYADQRLWLIHVGAFNNRIAYLDDQTEQPRGLDVDVVNAVCRWSRKRCRIVYDTYANCLDGASIGPGLLNNYYYACAGWAPTFARQETVVFSEAHYRIPGSIFITRRGNPNNFDPFNLGGATIGFIIEFAANAACINKQRSIQGVPLSDGQVRVYESIEFLQEDLDSGAIDAGFIAETLQDTATQDQVGDVIRTCTQGDVGVMAAHTSVGQELLQWWNDGLRRLLASKEYREICDRIETVHGDIPGRSKEDLCLIEY